jgi:hypothetical protein
MLAHGIERVLGGCAGAPPRPGEITAQSTPRELKAAQTLNPDHRSQAAGEQL